MKLLAGVASVALGANCYGWTKFLTGNSVANPESSNLLGHVTGSLNWEMSVNIQCTHDVISSDWANILHVTNGGDAQEFGNRLFGIWQRPGIPGGFHVATYNIANHAYQSVVELPPCVDGEWNTYTITQGPLSYNPGYRQVVVKKDGEQILESHVPTSDAEALVDEPFSVYLGDPWYGAAFDYNVFNFFHRDLLNDASYECAKCQTLLDDSGSSPAQGKVLGHVTGSSKFEMSVDIQCTHDHVSHDWYNILHMTNGGNEQEFGNRIFGIWQQPGKPGSLSVATYNLSNAAFQSYVLLDPCVDGEWNTYSITQAGPDHNNYQQVIVKKDGEQILESWVPANSVNSLVDKPFAVYLGDPWDLAGSQYNVKNFVHREL